MGIPGAQSPARLGRYELIAKLATGGMGEIFLAKLEGAAGFEKLFVVKRILPHLADDTRFRSMLIAEAQIASKMSHANICQVYELDETDGQLYIVMEYLEGVTLLPLLRRASKKQATLDFGFIAAVTQQVCDALHYAHEIHDKGDAMGVVHRDVSPANIFVTETGVAKVLDFGIAKVKNASAKTEDGAVKGKYAYMAPEQLRGGSIDRRVDVFALGVVLYEMIALRRLFQRKTDYLTFRAVMEQPVPDIRRYRGDVPETLVGVLARALERDPEARWKTARQFGTAVLDAIAPMRPRSQGELGDYVRANFSNELGKRSNAVHTVVHRTVSGPRTTMPLIGAVTEVAHEEDEHDDDGFLPVETEVDGAIMIEATRPAHEPQTPPPFALETSASGASIEALRSQPATGPVVAAPRSLLWPLVALAAVAITAVALVLLWKSQQAPASVVIEQRSDPRGTAQTPAPDPGSAAAKGSEPPGGGATTPPSPPPKAYDYNKPVKARQAALADCVARHGGSLPPDALASIEIDVAGKAAVTLSPPALGTTEMGGCIRRILASVSFPPGPHRLDLRLH